MHLCRLIMSRSFSRIAALLSLFLVSFNSSAQCAMCKAVAESNAAAGGGEAAGLNYGIMWLMVFPYLLMVTVGVLWYRHNKKTKRQTVAE